MSPNLARNKPLFDKDRSTGDIADARVSIEAKTRSKETKQNTLNVAIDVQVHMRSRDPGCKRWQGIWENDSPMFQRMSAGSSCALLLYHAIRADRFLLRSDLNQ